MGVPYRIGTGTGTYTGIGKRQTLPIFFLGAIKNDYIFDFLLKIVQMKNKFDAP